MDVQTLGAALSIMKKSSMDPEQIETAVDSWLDENITNPSNPPLDRSLTQDSAAAPADLVGSLKSAINHFNANFNSVSLWQEGYYGASGGAYSAKTQASPFCCTINALPESADNLSCPNTYEMRLQAWDGTTYVGAWTGSGFVKSTTGILYSSSFDLKTLRSNYQSYTFKAVIRNATSASTDVPLSDTASVQMLGSIIDEVIQNSTEVPGIKDDIDDIEIELDGKADFNGIIKKLREGFMPFIYEWESGKIQSGADASDPTRIRTKGYYSTSYPTVVYTLTGYEMYVVYYDDEYTYKTYQTWFTVPYTIQQNYPYYRLLLRKTNQTNIDVSESVNAVSNIYQDVLQHEDLSNKNAVVNTMFNNGASFTFIKDILYVFSRSNNDDYTSPTTNNYKYFYDPVLNKLSQLGKFTSNMGHQNTVDYCEEIDCLLSASGGSSSNVMPSEIFLFPDASTREDFDVTDEDVIRINVSSLDWGKQLNCVWGETNKNQHNIIYCLTNYQQGNMEYYAQSHPNQFTGDSKRFIRRVLLGKGSNELENGTIISGVGDDEFNGTFKVMNLWEWDFLTNEAINDACFYDGRIYENINKSDSGQCYIIHEINDFSATLKNTKIEIPVFNANGTPLAQEGEGITIKYGRLFIGSQYINIYDQWRKV